MLKKSIYIADTIIIIPDDINAINGAILVNLNAESKSSANIEINNNFIQIAKRLALVII